jgi:hypothetical protein
MPLTDIHGEFDHDGCPDPYCCFCECHICKRIWFALGRPRSEDCPKHGAKLREALARLRQGAIAEALTALVAPDGLVPTDETVVEFEAHLRLLGFAVVPLSGIEEE